jgi:hypothetical protein
VSVSDDKQLKGLETENGRLKRLVGDALLENEVTKEALRKSGERLSTVRDGTPKSQLRRTDSARYHSGATKTNRMLTQSHSTGVSGSASTPQGFLVITCPDLQSVCQLVANDQLTDTAYVSPAGPISPLDILYGFRPSLSRGDLYMAHRRGFKRKVLHGTLRSAGFKSVVTLARPRQPYFDLCAVATPITRSTEEMKALAAEHFPRP